MTFVSHYLVISYLFTIFFMNYYCRVPHLCSSIMFQMRYDPCAMFLYLCVVSEMVTVRELTGNETVRESLGYDRLAP